MDKNKSVQFKKRKTFKEWVLDLAEPTLLFLIIACSNGITWGLPQIFSTSNFHYPIIPLDNMIPTISWFIWFYWLTFPLAIASIYILYFKDRKNLYSVLITIEIAYFISMIFYIFYQTEMIKPDIVVSSISDKMLLYTWGACNPTCCFPSQHCFMAISCIFAMLFSKNINIVWRIIEVLLAIMIMLSTIFCKQHYFVDVIASIIIMIVVYALIKAFKLGEKTANKVQSIKNKTNK